MFSRCCRRDQTRASCLWRGRANLAPARCQAAQASKRFYLQVVLTHKYYGFGGAAAGIADAKLPDMQAGWEQGISNVMAGLSGLNMVYEAVGMHASLLGFCHESLVLGDDMLGQALRCVRGIDVTDEALSIDTMKSVCMGGPGHYLGHAQTLGVMQTEYIYPAVADKNQPKEWKKMADQI